MPAARRPLRTRIGVMAPASPIAPALAERTRVLAPEGVEIVFHPQCFLADGHFAGPDRARENALVELADDPTLDAVWFARGGYGACRIAESGAGSVRRGGAEQGLDGLQRRRGAPGGAAAARVRKRRPRPDPGRPEPGRRARSRCKRALDWLCFEDPAALEPSAKAAASRPGLQHRRAELDPRHAAGAGPRGSGADAGGGLRAPLRRRPLPLSDHLDAERARRGRHPARPHPRRAGERPAVRGGAVGDGRGAGASARGSRSWARPTSATTWRTRSCRSAEPSLPPIAGRF